MNIQATHVQNPLIKTSQESTVDKTHADIAPETLAKAQEVAKEFEGMFISEMVSRMFAEMKSNPLFGGGHGEETYKSMWIDAIAKSVSTKSIGIAENVLKVLLKDDNLQRYASPHGAKNAISRYRAYNHY